MAETNARCESIKRSFLSLVDSIGNLCAAVGDEAGRGFLGMIRGFTQNLPAPFIVQSVAALKLFFPTGVSKQALELALRGPHVDAARRPAHEAILSYPDLDGLLKRGTVLLNTAETVTRELPPNPYIDSMLNMCLQLGQNVQADPTAAQGPAIQQMLQQFLPGTAPIAGGAGQIDPQALMAMMNGQFTPPAALPAPTPARR